MRPIKLSMTAFGPYKNVEVVDFRELNDRNLFLITGPTGAGKTTIFDAISFAIYGEASGNLRSADSLRSHFSDDQLLTEVELEFELKATRYHIHRIPRQSKPKARGEGSTEQKPDATLTIYNGEPKTIIAGVTNVNEKVAEILGINAEQFRQIMMIPQGEFQKLLTASTEDRERVLQQLFDTGIYNTIQQKLDLLAKNLYAEIKRHKEIRDHEISRIEGPDQVELQALIAADDKNIAEIIALAEVQLAKDQQESKRLEATLQATQQNIEKLIAAREKTRDDNENLRLKETTSLKLADKELAEADIARLNKLARQAERAEILIPVEENFILRKADFERKHNDLNTVTAQIQLAQIKAKETEQAYQEEASPERSKQREQLIAELARLRSLEDKVTRIEAISLSITRTEQQCQQLEAEKRKTSAVVSTANTAIDKLRLEREAAKEAELNAAGKKIALDKTRDIGQKLKKLQQLQSEASTVNSRQKAEASQANELQQQLELSTRQHTQAKLDLMMNQAAVLARELKENDPCPVCGSTHHSALAKFSGHAVSEEELASLEVDLKKLEAAYQSKKTSLAILEERSSKLAESETELLTELVAGLPVELSTELSVTFTQQLDGLSAEARKACTEAQLSLNDAAQLNMQAELSALEQSAKACETFAADLEKLTADITTAEGTLSDLSAQYLEASKTLSEHKTRLSQIFDEVPENIRSSIKLRAAIEAQENQQQKSKQKLESTRQAHENAKAVLLTLNANKDQLGKDLITVGESLEKARQNLDAKIAESGFNSIESYNQAKLPPETTQHYKHQIEQHAKELHALKEQLADLTNRTKDLQPLELSVFDTQLETLHTESAVFSNARSAAINRSTNNTNILRAVEDINSAIGDKETTYKVVGNLAKVAQGNNPSRITFERYVLAAFLEDIISAANNRLNQMTSGRYKLSRTEELQRSNAKGGLELEVYDNYTGKSRHVKTLSGGEGFKASLAMALGLADVVQSYAGGVQLDTMFIDEGFGTLDQESLDSAISCLIDLQKTGRLVGIISHVTELKERLNTRLEVYSTNTGSGTRFVIG